MITSYNEAHDLWTNTRRRKLANNTYLEVCPNGPQGADGRPFWYGVRLHSTIVVKFNREGSVELNSGGWLTVTTKDRMNCALGRQWGWHTESPRWQIWSNQGIWYVGYTNGHRENYRDKPPTEFAYADGITLHPDGTVTGEGDDPHAKLKLRRQIKTYARDYMKAFWSGDVPAPGGGDCWCCLFKATDGTYPLHGDGDHILSHLKEKYYVPTLLSRAVKRFPISKAAEHVLAVAWNPTSKEQGYELATEKDGCFGSVADWQLGKSLQRFLYELTGTAG